MTWSIGVVGLDASLGLRVTSMWTKLSLGGYKVAESPSC